MTFLVLLAASTRARIVPASHTPGGRWFWRRGEVRFRILRVDPFLCPTVGYVFSGAAVQALPENRQRQLVGVHRGYYLEQPPHFTDNFLTGFPVADGKPRPGSHPIAIQGNCAGSHQGPANLQTLAEGEVHEEEAISRKPVGALQACTGRHALRYQEPELGLLMGA